MGIEYRPIKKVLIANRGEIAVRVIRACREMNIKSVAVYSAADENSMHVQMADEAICVGPPAGKDSYMNVPNVIMAAKQTQADAIHPGYGYLSENAAFAEACEVSGLTFIGAPPDAMNNMGDKSEARNYAKKARVPVIPGSNGPVSSESEALRQARKIGYPVLLKAVAGGGGKGIRLARDPEEFTTNLRLAKAEAAASFGSADIYIEKLITDARHIEVQIMADVYGNAIHLGERDCSVQTPRRQKVVEEAPAIGLDPKVRTRMTESAIRLVKQVGYRGAGTVEFLYDHDGHYYFMEMNTRLQVEHCVTEALTDTDLVQMQILVASGDKLPLSQRDVTYRGHNIEVRITAEDPDQGLIPTSGVVQKVVFPGGLGVRIDSHIYSGYELPPYYDSLLAKLIVHAPTRQKAIDRMNRALKETIFDGVKTNLPLLRKIMQDAEYQQGGVNTDYLKRLLQPVEGM